MNHSRIPSFTKLVAITVAASALLVAGFAATAQAASIGSFSVRPAEVDVNNPLTRSYFIHTLPAGGSFRAHVVVANTGRQPIDLYVYPVQGLTGTTSGVVYGNRQDARGGAARWVHPDVNTVHVGAGSQLRVGFSVLVPADAKAGDHVAGIALQPVKATRSGGRFSITEVLRGVVGIELKVAGAASPAISLQGAALHPLPGTNFPAVVVKLSDVGLKLCKPHLQVSLRRSGSLGTVSHPLDTVLPGDTIQYPFPWPHALAAGTYSTTVRATGCGAPATLTAVTTLGKALSRDSTSGAAPTPSTQSGPSWWLFALIGIGGLALGLAGSRLLKRIGKSPVPE
jgi:hypothetical protein